MNDDATMVLGESHPSEEVGPSMNREGVAAEQKRSGLAAEIMLCADSESLAHPESIGLDDELISAQPWLRTESDARRARSIVRDGAPSQEIWVAGSDQMDAINLAAALKHDRSDSIVCLLAFQGNGSLLSRARSAGVDEVLDKAAFLGRYGSRKRSRSRTVIRCDSAAQPVVSPASADMQEVARAQIAKDPDTSNRVATWADSKTQVIRGEGAFMLAIVGAGGGVGKSTISVLAACLAQSMGYRTVLVDGDLQFGDVHYLTGRDDALRIDDLIASPSRIDSLKPQDGMPAVLAAPARMEHSEAIVEELPHIVALLRKRFDIVVVNTGPTWSDEHISLLEDCSNALFVIDQRPSSIRACKHALELCARCGIASQPFLFTLNRCSRNALFSSIDVSCALRGARVTEFSDGGREVEELLGAGQPLDLAHSRNPLCASIRELLRGVLPKLGDGDGAADESFFKEGKRKRRFSVRRKKAACL